MGPSKSGGRPALHQKRGRLVLMPDPKYVRTLLSRYADFQTRLMVQPNPELRRQLDEVSYTLCVSTGTRTIQEALVAADLVLETGALKAP